MPLIAPRYHELRAVHTAAQCLGTHICTCADPISHNAHTVSCVCTHGRNALIIAVEDDCPAGRDRLHKLRLCRCNILDGAEEFDMHLADIRHNANVWRSNGCKLCDLPQPAHADLDDGGGILCRYAEQCQRQPDFVVVVRRRPADRTAPRKDGGRQILRRRLAIRAGDRNNGNREFHAPSMRDVLICLERVLGHENSPSFLFQRLLHRLGDRRTDQNSCRALAEGIRGEVRTVEMLPAQSDEQIPRRDPPRICRNVGDRIIFTQLSAVQSGTRRRKHLSPCHRHTTAP